MFTYSASVSAEKTSLHIVQFEFLFFSIWLKSVPPPPLFLNVSLIDLSLISSESFQLCLSDGSVYSFDKGMVLLCSKQWSDSVSQGAFGLPENKNRNHQLKYSAIMYV